MSNLIFQLVFPLFFNLSFLDIQGVGSLLDNIIINNDGVTHDESVILSFQVNIKHFLLECNDGENNQEEVRQKQGETWTSNEKVRQFQFPAL